MPIYFKSISKNSKLQIKHIFVCFISLLKIQKDDFLTFYINI